MYYGKSSESKIAIAKQRAVSRKIMAAIDNQKRREEKNESRKARWEVNSYWIKRLMTAIEAAFSDDAEILSLIREKVFAKWEKYRYNREFYLAPTDIYRELEIYPVELKKRVEEIALKLRKEKEESESYKK